MRTILTILIVSLSSASMAAAQDYFPLKEGNQWIYTRSNGAELTTKVTGSTDIDGIHCAIVEATTQNGTDSNVSVDYMTVDTEGVKVYMTEIQGVPIVYNPPVLRIKLPFTKGQIWTSKLDQEGVTITTTSDASRTEEIRTDAGIFKCIVINSRVSIPGQGITTSEYYYADGVGMVRQVIQVSGQRIILSLKSYNVKPTDKIGPPQKPVSQQQMHCPYCGAIVSPDAKFCPSCGKALPLASQSPSTETPTICPNCGAELPEGAKFCPSCGAEIKADSAQIERPAVDVNDEKKLTQYVSDTGSLMLYKPQSWKVVERNIGESAYSASIIRPDYAALVVFVAFPVGGDVNDSVSLAGVCLKEFKKQIPDLNGTNVKSNSDKSRTVMDITFTAGPEKGIGHGYFFYTQNAGTVYLLLTRDDLWKELHPLLTSIAANIAYSPEGIEKSVNKAKNIAANTEITEQERILNPAAIIQKAKNASGKQLELISSSLPDKSLELQIPRGWNLDKVQDLNYLLIDNRQTHYNGMFSISSTVILSPIPIPGVLNTEYLPAPQALELVLKTQGLGTDMQILGELPGEQALPELAEAIQNMQMQGYQVDSRLIDVNFSGVSGKTLRGIFSVQCISSPLNPVWQVSVDGSWAPEDEYDQWLPLYLRIGETFKWTQTDETNKYYTLQQLNRNLQNSIADANQPYDEYIDNLENADRSRNYTSWLWNQTTLGQSTWVAKNEGAEVLQTGIFGIQRSSGGTDTPSYNTISFTGTSPWSQEQLESIDTHEEFENYLSGS